MDPHNTVQTVRLALPLLLFPEPSAAYAAEQQCFLTDKQHIRNTHDCP